MMCPTVLSAPPASRPRELIYTVLAHARRMGFPQHTIYSCHAYTATSSAYLLVWLFGFVAFSAFVLVFVRTHLTLTDRASHCKCSFLLPCYYPTTAIRRADCTCIPACLPYAAHGVFTPSMTSSPPLHLSIHAKIQITKTRFRSSSSLLL